MATSDYIPKSIKIPQFRIKFRDVFHLRNLYIMMHEYLGEEGWKGSLGSGHVFEQGDIETLYSEKFFQKGLHLGGKEMWVYWRLKKDYEGKFSGYFRNKLDVDMHMAYIQDIEVMHQGKKMRAQRGEIEIFVRPRVELDYNNEWGNHWLLKHFKRLYEDRIMSQEMDKREKELWREAYRFQGKIKRFLNMRTFIPVPEPFHPQIQGYEAEPGAGGGRLLLK